MKPRSIALTIALCLLMYAGICGIAQAAWENGCGWYLAEDTPVYTPGMSDEIALTLPAGTGCRVDASVGDSWQAIEYMLNGQTFTGMVRADALTRRTP